MRTGVYESLFEEKGVGIALKGSQLGQERSLLGSLPVAVRLNRCQLASNLLGSHLFLQEANPQVRHL